jgi:hypothetical protein
MERIVVGSATISLRDHRQAKLTCNDAALTWGNVAHRCTSYFTGCTLQCWFADLLVGCWAWKRLRQASPEVSVSSKSDLTLSRSLVAFSH